MATDIVMGVLGFAAGAAIGSAVKQSKTKECDSACKTRVLCGDKGCKSGIPTNALIVVRAGVTKSVKLVSADGAFILERDPVNKEEVYMCPLASSKTPVILQVAPHTKRRKLTALVLSDLWSTVTNGSVTTVVARYYAPNPAAENRLTRYFNPLSFEDSYVLFDVLDVSGDDLEYCLYNAKVGMFLTFDEASTVPVPLYFKGAGKGSRFKFLYTQ